MDIKLPSQSASTQSAVARVGDPLSQLRAAGSVEAEVVKMLPGKLLLTSRLGEILTSNTLNFKPGDRLQLRLDTSGREAVLKATPAPSKPVQLDRVEIPHLVRLLPAGKPLLASVQRVVARQAEIRISGQLLRLPPAVDARRGDLLSLQRNDSRRQVEITRLERKPIYKALLKQLVPRAGAGGRDSLVKLVELLNDSRRQAPPRTAPAMKDPPAPVLRTQAGESPLRPSSDPQPARRETRAAELARPTPKPPPTQATAPGSALARGTASSRASALQWLAAATVSTQPLPPPATAKASPRLPPELPAQDRPGTAADRPQQPAAAAAQRATRAGGTPQHARAQIAAGRAPESARNAQQPAANMRARPLTAAQNLAGATAPVGQSSNPATVQTRAATAQALPRAERPVFASGPKPRGNPSATVPAAAARGVPPVTATATSVNGAASGAASPAAGGAPAGDVSAAPLKFLSQLALRLPQLDAERVRSWFEAAGLVKIRMPGPGQPTPQDIPALLKRLLEPEGLQRELGGAARSRGGAEADAGPAAPRSAAGDALAQLQRDGARLVEQSLAQNLLQRASLGLQQETQQPLAINLALPLIDEHRIKPLYIDLAQRSRSERRDDDCWEIRIRFEFAGLGPVACHIVLEDRAVAASFYSELADTRTGIEQALPELRRQLLDAGFKPGDFHSFQGQLQRAAAPTANDFGESLIDIEV